MSQIKGHRPRCDEWNGKPFKVFQQGKIAPPTPNFKKERREKGREESKEKQPWQTNGVQHT